MAYKNRLTNRQIADALHMAQWVDASPHEWPTSDKIPHLCYAVLDLYQHRHEAQELLASAVERAEKAEGLLDHLQQTQQGVYFIPGDDGEDGQFSVGQYSDPDIRKAITASMEAE